MVSERIWITLLWTLFIFHTTEAQCTVQGKTEQGFLKLLDPIVGKKFEITDAPKNYTYNIGICTPVKGTQDVGVLQTGLKDESHGTKNVGLITQTHIQKGTDWLLLTYKGGEEYGHHCTQEARKAVIMIVCDPVNLSGTIKIIAENADKTSECYYLFEFGSSVACSTSSGSSGLSVGSIICIIFFVVVLIYLIGGVLYQRCAVGAKGMEQIPNIVFWRELGNLIADGTDLVFRSTPKGQPKTYKGIGDDQLTMDDDDDRDDHLLPM
ncbi:cation-dependent mannose-6-phosphate receptor-like [Glandiceps talaboti]